MLPLIIVVVFLFVFRILGIAGIGLFATWEASARFALALMFLFVASSHFTKTDTAGKPSKRQSTAFHRLIPVLELASHHQARR